VRKEVSQLENDILSRPRSRTPTLQASNVVICHHDDGERNELGLLDEFGEKVTPHIGLFMENDRLKPDPC